MGTTGETTSGPPSAPGTLPTGLPTGLPAGLPNAAPLSTGRRAEILRAAGTLFRRNGYHATSMRQLARHLNLQGASLYAHIDSKEQLLREIVERAADAFLTSARSISADADPTSRLASFIRGHLCVVEREIETAAVFFHEWTHLEDGVRRQIIELRDAYQAHLKSIIDDGVKAGRFHVQDVNVATLLVLSTLNWSYQWFDPHGRLPLERLAQQYIDFVQGALGAKEGAAGG